jgi:hypothetical protein
VSENQDELFKLIGFYDKDISASIINGKVANGIIKTKDNKFLFFSADKKGCFVCAGHSYVINVDKKTISDFKINNVLFNVTPVFGSLVVTQLDHEKMLVYDSAKDKIIDEIEYPVGETGSVMPFYNFLFGSDRYYTYTYKNILYSRDIARHVSTPIGNFYDPEIIGVDNMKSPSGFSDNGEIFYTLIYINKDDTRPYSQMAAEDPVTPKNDDPLQFIAWNFKDNTSKVVTTQTFNFPFSFKFLTKNSVLIGGGGGRYGLETYQTYLVNTETGESKIIYNGPTNSIKVDEIKQEITILGSKNANSYRSPFREDSDYEIVLDYNGNIISKNDLVNGKLVSPKDLYINVESTSTNVYPPSSYEKLSKPIVELFVMSYDPFGIQMERGILPVIEVLGDKIDFKIKFNNYAMHGEKELKENLTQYCIQKEQASKLTSYLKCFFNNSDSVSCLDKAEVNKASLDSCISKTDNEFQITANYNNKIGYQGNYPGFNVYKDDNIKYNVGGSPTLIINGENIQSKRDSVSLLKTICDTFLAQPKECDTKLSNIVPQLGFGF